MKKKFICPICGFVFEGEQAPERCPQCKQLVEWKVAADDKLNFACEHILGVAKNEQDPIIHEEVKEVLEEPKEQIIKNDEVLPNVKVEKPIKKTPKKKANPKKKTSEKKPIVKVEDTSEQKPKKRQPRKQSTKKKAE